MRLRVTKSNIFLRRMFLNTNQYFFTFARMKAQQNRFNPHQSCSKYKPFDFVLLAFLVTVNMLCTMLSGIAANGKEKLQIRYANLRV
jgi:hypothetical protein